MQAGHIPPGGDPCEDPAAQPVRVVLHVDCDEFFLQVHERRDARVAAAVAGRACALVQYNDVICANAAAKAAGVQKHQAPAEARRRLAPHGRLLHAFWRRWPGPRVSYHPYQCGTSGGVGACWTVRFLLRLAAARSVCRARRALLRGVCRARPALALPPLM